MLVVFVIVAVIVVFAVAAVAVGHGGGLAPAERDLGRPALPEAQLSAADVDSVGFAIGFRGYRMDQVDGVLDRLGRELAERDARIDELERRVAGTGHEGSPAG
jgi:DivIVA domain-containing protein